MLTCTTTEGLHTFLAATRSKGLTIGFVPTMGALHEGHLSLIDAALKANDIVVCSVFVNRAQFNDSSDFDKYPRMPEKDQAMVRAAGCHALFMPAEDEMFPPIWKEPHLNFGIMDQVMEGKFRPGHFKGMVKVVHRLFELVKPDKAYFGEKDFQQLALIRSLAAKKHPSIEVIGCPTLREADGLALSSRNLLLTKAQRAAAPLIYKTLNEAVKWLQYNTVDEVKARVAEAFRNNNYLRLQYFEIVDENTLEPLIHLQTGKHARACIAVLTDGPRLIDNVRI